MNWWLNFYFGEGPGIAKDAPRPVGIRRVGKTALREWWGLVQLNLLFIACALPLITLPAAFAAMLGVCAIMVDDQPQDVWREFRDGFLRVFWRATAIGVAVLIVLGLGLMLLRFYAIAAKEVLLFALPLGIGAMVLLFLSMALIVFFTLLGRHQAPMWDLLKAACITTLIRPGPLLAAVAVNLAIWLLHILGYPATVFFAVTLNFSLGALVMAFAAHECAQTCLAYVKRSRQAPL